MVFYQKAPLLIKGAFFYIKLNIYGLFNCRLVIKVFELPVNRSNFPSK